MTKDSFFRLFDIIELFLPDPGKYFSRVPNGTISKEARLCIAIRAFAGGDKFDIAEIYCVNESEVNRSMWFVVDAINNARELDISYPTCHIQQSIIVRGFKEKSTINIDNCTGAIDGILIWINKPTTPDTKDVGLGPLKFYCGRKKFWIKYASSL